MKRFDLMLVVAFVIVSWPAMAYAQTSSLGAKERHRRASAPTKELPREAEAQPRNAVYESYSWIANPPKPPKRFRPNDLITIIVRQQRSYKAESDLGTDKSWDLTSKITALAKLTQGGLGAATFQRGKPNIKYSFENQIDSEADTSRKDRMTTRLTATILDVKPNGQLVLQARASLTHDEEISVIRVTGICRKEDVTADNTILSTQIAQLDIAVDNKGALRASARRGWIPKLIDWLNPI